MTKKNTSTKKMKIITSTVKTKEAVECHNSKDAYKIFKQMLSYETYELKSQGLAAA